MPTVNLGRVGIVNKGTYVGSTTPYKINDIVKYNNSIYICIQAHAVEHLPTDVLYWQVWVDAANYYIKSEVDGLIQTDVGTPIASASTTAIGGPTAGDIIHITGVTTITSLGVSTAGTIRTLVFDGALTITHNATSLILPGGVNALTVAGSVGTFVCENGALGYWRCTSLTHSSVSMAELLYISTLTSDAQTQINTKAPIASPVFTGNVTGLGVSTGTSFNAITGLASVAPLASGAAAVGTSTLSARQDHVHPSQTTITGNAGTATVLQTARAINGVNFDGSASISIEDRIGTTIASATTTTIGTAGLGEYIHISGVTTITSFGTAASAGVRRSIIFDSALTLTHNATSLICPGAANIVTVAGTVIEVVAETTGNWRVLSVSHPSVSMAELSYISTLTSDAQTQLNGKAPIASPTFSGTVSLPSTTSIGNVSATELGYLDGVTSNIQAQLNAVDTLRQDTHIPLSGVTAYNLLAGGITLSNSVVTAGMATTLYTGNGTTQSVVTGVDMATQWGNSSSETFGGLIWGKSRSATNNHALTDTVRGVGKIVYSDLTNTEAATGGVTSFNSDGFSLSSASIANVNTVTEVSWNFQTTHRITGTTNHGKAYTCHYNPFTGFTIVKYEGSGLAGHEIPHHLGRKLGFASSKNLSVVLDWLSFYKEGRHLQLNLTLADAASTTVVTSLNENNTTIGTSNNTSAQQFIMYGWADSYFDESNTLIGNYEIGTYQGTGAAGNKVTTKGKPAWIMVKRLDSTGNWYIEDNQRTFSKTLNANDSAIEAANSFYSVGSDGFTLTYTGAETNASGGQYLYMVVYDNDSGSGKSKYPRATDTSALSLTATIPFANGLDTNGTKNTVLTKNETVTGLTLTQGKNYVYAKNDGLYGVKAQAPQYGSYNGFGDYFDVAKNQWYQSPSVFSDTMDAIGTWTIGTGGALTLDSGRFKLTRTDTSSQFMSLRKTFTLVAGKKYRVQVKFDSGTLDRAIIQLFDASYTTTVISGNWQYNSGYVTIDFVSNGTDYLSVGIGQDSTIGRYAWIDSATIYPINNDGSVDITSATPITESRNYLDAIVYADAGGQPTFVEQLPKIEYKKDLEVDTMKVLSGFDLNQKWYDVTSSRVLGATYTNTTGKPIQIHITTNSSSLTTIALIVNGITVYGSTAEVANRYITVNYIIPNGSTYNVVAAANTLIKWTELR